MQGKLFVFGYGFVAAALAKRLRAEGWEVSGTARNALKREACAPFGVRLVDFTDRAGIAANLREATHALCCVPPAQVGGDPALKAHRDLLDSASGLRWLGYCSTSGVYGDAQGGAVDEDTPPAPMQQRGRLRLEAERGWAKLALPKNIPLAIFRISGIYGPGQCAIDQLREGRARRIDKPGHRFNRIHVEDIAGIVQSAMQAEAAGVFNLADHGPSTARAVMEYAAALTGMALPPLEDFATAELSPMMREFYAASRRVTSRRMAELGYRFRYPTYREGLDAYARELDAAAREADAG